MFEEIVKEVHRWAGIVQNTAKEILETQEEKEEDPKKDN